MMRDEAKNGRGEQSRSRRASKTEMLENGPLVSAKRGKFESLRDTKVEAVIFARLGDYKAFVKEVEGEEPEDGAVVSAGLEMLFAADKGFEQWQGERRKKERPTGERDRAGSLLRTPVPSSATTSVMT